MKMLVEIDSDTQVVAPKDLLSDLVTQIERKTCLHEETYRGGAIWEICHACDAKWADDEGGKPEFQWPECVESAREILSATPQEPVQPDFDPIVPERALIAGGKALELAIQSGITSPRTLALVAYTDIALTLHKSEQQPVQPIPTGERWTPVGERLPAIGEKVDLFISGVVQDETYELDQGDDGFGGGGLFWSRDDIDECPAVDWERDMWRERPKAPARPSEPGGE